MPFQRFVEVGRVAYAVDGPAKNKLAVIIDVIDYTRVLIDGPCSRVSRQEYRVNQLVLTRIKLNIRHSQHSKHVAKAWKEAKVEKRWACSDWAKTVKKRKLRQNLTDYERFKVARLKLTRNIAAAKVFEAMGIAKKKSIQKSKLRKMTFKVQAKKTERRIAKVKKAVEEAKTKRLKAKEEGKKFVGKNHKKHKRHRMLVKKAGKGKEKVGDKAKTAKKQVKAKDAKTKSAVKSDATKKTKPVTKTTATKTEATKKDTVKAAKPTTKGTKSKKLIKDKKGEIKKVGKGSKIEKKSKKSAQASKKPAPKKVPAK